MPGFEIIDEQERAAVNAVFDNGGVLFRQSFAGMRNGVYKVKEFETAFAAFLGVRHSQAVTSGTSAIKVGLKALGVGPGDEVVTQSHTFVATVEAILECGAVPVIANVDESLNMDPADLERVLSPRTRAVIPVHMLGVAADMDRILAIAGERGIPVLEDTAQACGGTWKGRMLGTLGAVGTFSFDHGKFLTTGEGGMVVTNDPDLFFRARCYSDHGHEDNPAFPRGEDTRSRPGFNYRMMELQGAIGVVQLGKLPASLERHRANQQALRAALQARLGGGVTFRRIDDPAGDTGDAVAFFLPNPTAARAVARDLQSRGIGFKNLPDALNWHFAGTWDHLLAGVPWLKDKTLAQHCAPSDAILRRAIALPIFYKMDAARIEFIAAQVADAVAKHASMAVA
jgi:8-amino-3,8-dideoxy-alpha-D-manno-octulosonate transaminase